VIPAVNSQGGEVFREVAKSPEYIALEAKSETQMKKTTRAAYAEMQAGVDVEQVRVGLEVGDELYAFEATNVNVTVKSFDALADDVESAMVKAADITLDAVEVQGGFVFNPQSAGLRGALNTVVNQHIVGIKNSTSTAIRETIRDAISTGRHPLNAAKDIQKQIGLTSRQTNAIENLRAKLIEDGVKPDVITKRLARQTKKFKAQRAEAIARTETSNAINAGRQDLWEQLQRSGALPMEQEIKWITALDERVCQICGPMSNQTVGLRSNFQVTFPKAGGQEEVQLKPHPPAHPQ
jgi:hypothetical protein